MKIWTTRIISAACAFTLATCTITPAALADTVTGTSDASWAASAGESHQADPMDSATWRADSGWTNEETSAAAENTLASIAPGDSNSTWTKANGYNTYTLRMSDYDSGHSVSVPKSQAVGIDVSEWNGSIDWNAVANSGVTCVIVRCGYGDDYSDQDDKRWAENIRGALNAGLEVGVYLYSYALNAYTTDSSDPQSAQSEAAHVLRCLSEAGVEPGDLALPVYYDMEDQKSDDPKDTRTHQYDLSADQLGEIATVFCDTIEAAGYEAGIYANQNWWTNKLTASCFSTKGWSRWAARYSEGAEFTDSGVTSTDIWQFSNCGTVEGVSGRVDMNFDFVFSGEDIQSDSLTRLAGPVALDTMAQITKTGWANGTCDTVVLATMATYHDALTASGLAGLYGCPILITNGENLSSQTASEISRLGAKHVVVVGGDAAVTPTVRAQVEQLGCTVSTPAQGATAIETALDIYETGKSVGTWGTTCVVATSSGYWDALSASPYAYAMHAPIFLTCADGSISSAVLDAVRNGGFTRVVVVGGDAAVSSAVYAQLADAIGSGSIMRLGGSNAYGTSLYIANFCLSEGMSATHTAYATGTDFYDALTGAALAGKYASPLLLCDRGYEAQALAFTRDNSSAITSGEVFGGYAAVSPVVLNRIAVLLK